MLKIHINAKKYFRKSTETFEEIPETELCLEHSLVSLSKWESKYKKPFLEDENKTVEEILDYIRMMTLTQNVNPNIYQMLTKEELVKINEYIQDPMTATRFYENSGKNGYNDVTAKRPKEKITSELIYYWMISFQIPFECQKWHLNRLLTLIRVCGVKEKQQQKGGKMNRRDILSQNAALNAARRQRLKSHG